MKNKILIGAGILLTVFVLFLIFLCGGSGADKIVTEEELKVTIQNVTCQVNEEENDITYELGYLSNDVQFDNEIQTKSYNKIIVNQKVDINILGTAFMVKPIENTTMNDGDIITFFKWCPAYHSSIGFLSIVIVNIPNFHIHFS